MITPDNWFLRLFESTGSADHVASIMEGVRSLPGTWEPGEAHPGAQQAREAAERGAHL